MGNETIICTCICIVSTSLLAEQARGCSTSDVIQVHRTGPTKNRPRPLHHRTEQTPAAVGGNKTAYKAWFSALEGFEPAIPAP